MTDLDRGHLRPQTWAQLCDSLSVLAHSGSSLLCEIMELQDARRPLQELVANLSRAVAAESPRPDRDIAEALVLETITKLNIQGRGEEASTLESMWALFKLYNNGDFEKGRERMKT